MTIDHDTLAALQTTQATMMRAFADALSADLAVSPLVVGATPGMGTIHLLKGLAAAADMECFHVRCAMFDPVEIQGLPVLVAGEVERRPFRLQALRSVLDKGRPTLVVLDEAAFDNGAAREASRVMLEQVAEDASSPTIVALTGTIGEIDAMLDVVAAGTGIQRAHVPTCVRGIDDDGTTPPQPILLVGDVGISGSRHGERHLLMDVAAPYAHEVRLTLVATDVQDEDDLPDAVSSALAAGTVAIRATPDRHGSLYCTTADLDVLPTGQGAPPRPPVLRVDPTAWAERAERDGIDAAIVERVRTRGFEGATPRQLYALSSFLAATGFPASSTKERETLVAGLAHAHGSLSAWSDVYLRGAAA